MTEHAILIQLTPEKLSWLRENVGSANWHQTIAIPISHRWAASSMHRVVFFTQVEDATAAILKWPDAENISNTII
jgi:hypothetical protein